MGWLGMRVSGNTQPLRRTFGVLCVGVGGVLLLAGCAVGRGRAPTTSLSHAAQAGSPFEGTVHHPATGACPQVLPTNFPAPFGGLSTGPVTAAAYTVIGCRTGDLLQKAFVVDVYNGADNGSQGVAVQYNGRLMARVGTNGAVDTYQFTGTSVCWSEQAGAYFAGINIATGKVYPTVAAGDSTGPCNTHPGPPPQSGAAG